MSIRDRIRAKTKKKFQLAIRSIVKGLSRKVLIYRQPAKSECPNCYYDKMTDRSSGKCKWTLNETLAKNDTTKYKWFRFGRCPICHGKGYLETERKTWADCLVTWNPYERGNTMVYTPAGSEGSTIVKLKTDPKHLDEFKNCDRIVVDGVECKISRPPIMRGLGNQAILVVTAFTTEKPSIDSDELIKDYM